MLPELPTASAGTSQAPSAAVDNSAPVQPARCLFISWGKTVQTSGATSQGSDEEQAAIVLGATGWQTFWHVTLPNIKWALIYGVILCNARAMGEFGATLMVAGNLPGKTQTLSVAVYDAVQAGNDTQAWGLTAIISVLCMAVLIISGHLLRPARMRTVDQSKGKA